MSSVNKVLVIALTETWLKPFMKDAQINFEGYNVYRSDRRVRERGGALLYISNDIPVTHTTTFDDAICQAVFCCCSSTKSILVCAYKPCDASESSFCNMIDFINRSINETTNHSSYTIIVMGYFNFPDLWKVGQNDVTAKSKSEHYLLNFMSDHFLCQYIDQPTRSSNILELLLTNNERLVCHMKSERHVLFSDHNVLELNIPGKELLPSKSNNSNEQTPTKL